MVAVMISSSLSLAQVNLKPGDQAPAFKLLGGDGKDYQLAQFAGVKAVALCWFPRAGSQGAINQCRSLEAVLPNLPADKVQVFGCSTAPLDVTAAFVQSGGYSFPVLSDATRSVAQAYGCLKPDGVSERWTFLIDSKGIVLAVNKSTSPQTQGTDLQKMLADAGLMAQGAAAPARGDQQISLQVGALTRTCVVHLPPAYDGKRELPVVIGFHGGRGTGKDMKGTGLTALADQYGFIAAYPDGIAGDHTWNGLFGKIPGGEGLLADDVDDIAFTKALIDTLHTSYQTDPARVFVCGYSAGAYMAYRVAVELSDMIAAAGIVNGSLGIKSLDSVPCGATIPAPVAPVSLIHICGKQDGVVKFAGAQTPKNLFKSVPDCVDFFVQANQCATPGMDTNDAAAGVSRTLYTGGKEGTEVELVIVERANHSWPTAREGLVSSQALWDFFSTHPKQPGG
jgi:poly(3-hydroxybutyrate) depolymerase/peroxiredoxin